MAKSKLTKLSAKLDKEDAKEEEEFIRARHKAEQAVLDREKELKYDTDRLSASSLMTLQSHTNSSREIMAAQHLSQFNDIKDPEQPLVITGFENSLASYSDMIVEVDHDYEIVAKFEKNPYVYVLIAFDKKNRCYHAWKRVEMEEFYEGYCTRYDNKYIDSLEVGDVVHEGTKIIKPDNFDKYGNYKFGKNINVVYTTCADVYEDGILAMNGVDKMFNTYKSKPLEIVLSDNEVLLNLYGDDKHYQPFPLVGEKIKGRYVAVIRRIEYAKASYALKNKRLSQVMRSDPRKYQASGRVVDIDIWTNKDPKKMPDSDTNAVVNRLFDEQQAYYRKLYKYMINIIDNADPDPNNKMSKGNPNNPKGYAYSDEFSTICAEAKSYVSSSVFFSDLNDTVYGNTRIILHILDEDHLIVGSKLVGRSGNKGVLAKILPPEESWKLDDGTPVHFAVASLGVVGRLNNSQLDEFTCNELAATAVDAMKMTKDLDQKSEIVYQLLKYLNKDEAKDWKSWYKGLSKAEKERCCKKIEKRGITIIQPPINNCNIVDYANCYEMFPPNFRHIIYPDGGKSIFKVLCAKMFYIRLKQDPLDKYSTRSHGPVNPLTMLPSKSTEKKKGLAPYSDVAVRFGEMELEILQTMVDSPAAIAAYMTENSTSFEAKLEISKQGYTGDPESDIDMSDMTFTGKKNIEWIDAMISVLGTDIIIETEEAPEGEWFED